MAFAARKSLTYDLLSPVPPVSESPLFQNNPLRKQQENGQKRLSTGLSSPRSARRGINEGGVSKENEFVLWIDVFTCRGCLGHIPSSNFATHVLECSSASNVGVPFAHV